MTGNTIGTFGGAALGTLFGGPAGTALGSTVGGFLGGLFDEPAQAPGYKDYTDPKLSALSARLRRQKLGQQMAARQRTLNSRNAKRQTESFENDPNASRSGALRSGVYNSAYTNAEESNVNANIAGAGLDQSAEERAGQVDVQNQNLSMQRNQFERQGWAASQFPSAVDSAGATAFGLGIGKLLGSGGNQPATGLNTPKEFTKDYSQDTPQFAPPTLTNTPGLNGGNDQPNPSPFMEPPPDSGVPGQSESYMQFDWGNTDQVNKAFGRQQFGSNGFNLTSNGNRFLR